MVVANASTPVRIPAITSGSRDDASAPLARFAAATSSISTGVPLSLAAWVSICVTAGLAAEAVSSFPPANAPYTSRSAIAARAAASSA